jgi:hypothetical protein
VGDLNILAIVLGACVLAGIGLLGALEAWAQGFDINASNRGRWWFLYLLGAMLIVAPVAAFVLVPHLAD